MTELAPDPPYAAGEKQTLEAFLDYYRTVMIRKAEGLSEEDVRRRATPSALTLLGMIKHLAYVERWWFQMCFAGEERTHVSTDADPDADFRVEPDETTAEIVALYRAEIERSRQITQAALLDDQARRTARGERMTLRWILVHMIEETARHAGHADIIREAIDGSTGD